MITEYKIPILVDGFVPIFKYSEPTKGLKTEEGDSIGSQHTLAREETKKAIRAGILMRTPCAEIGCKERNTVVHHLNYDDPLDVIWLCRPHHHDRHKTIDC